MDQPAWFVVGVTVDSDEVDRVSGAAWAAGAAGIEERTLDDRTQLDVAVTADGLDAVKAAVGARIAWVRAVEPDEGLDAWREWAKPVQVGRVTIVPAWQAVPDAVAEPGAVVARIDPGRTFGSGAHVTTALALSLLQERLEPGMDVLDVGTGSGVLAIAAALLGAVRVVALDVEPEARRTARANIETNAVESIVTVFDTLLDDVTESFDIVVANIDYSTLTDLARSLTSKLRREGSLLLSGFLVDREPALVEAFPDVRFDTRTADGEWGAISGRRRDAIS